MPMSVTVDITPSSPGRGRPKRRPPGESGAARATACSETEATFHQRTALLDATLDVIDQGLVMTDADDRVRVFNRRAAALMGVPEALLYDGAPFGAVRDHQRSHGQFEGLPPALRRWLDTGEPADLVPSYERVRPDGTTLMVRTTALPQGGMVRVFHDVTRHRVAETALQGKTALLDATLETMDQGLIMVDADGIVRVCNERAMRLLDLPEALMRAQPAFPEVTAFQLSRGDFAKADATLRAAVESGGLVPHAAVYEREGVNGTVLEIRTVLLSQGGWVRTYTDVTERRAAQAAIQDSERRYRLLAENTHDLIVFGDMRMRRLYVSPACREVLGYEPEEFVERDAGDLVHPDDLPIYADLRAKVTGNPKGRYVASFRYRHKAGHHVWIETSARLVFNPGSAEPIGYVASLRDVTARQEAEAQLTHLALHDPLTGLPNRVLFRKRLDHELTCSARTGAIVAVLVCDLDHFKSVNDTLGHPTGDALLRVIGQRMRAVLRGGDTIARLGGDEFAVVVGHVDEPLATAYLAKRLIETVSQPLVLDGRQIEVGLSVGYAKATAAATDADTLFKRADIALYEAKAAGRNTYREFEAQAGERATIQGQLALDMKESLRRGDFGLVYQPVIDVATGRVMGFEALLRWNHPLHGAISPGIFIPLAEETGLITQLGAHVLREACREAATWPGGIRVAVNLSVVQLRQEGFEREVLEVLARSRLAPGRLQLEVTESVLIADAETSLVRLRRIKEMGVRIVLDDFGTGYSSLSYLRRFPFDKIKLDRSFIADIANEDTAAIVRAVVGIGDRLGMGIVAEGVESEDQLERVHREGCGEVQGFLYSRPLPPDAVPAFVREREAQARPDEAERRSA